MYKIMMCNCNRSLLYQLDVKYTYRFLFDDSRCDEKHDVFARRCKLCLYNLVDFDRTYFASVVCSCHYMAKHLVCGHCSHLLDLNFNIMKNCIAKKNLLKEMKLIEIDKYLEMCLKAAPIFFLL